MYKSKKCLVDVLLLISLEVPGDLVGLGLALLLQPLSADLLPLVPVGDQRGLQRPQPRAQLAQALVHWQAHTLDSEGVKTISRKH